MWASTYALPKYRHMKHLHILLLWDSNLQTICNGLTESFCVSYTVCLIHDEEMFVVFWVEICSLGADIELWEVLKMDNCFQSRKFWNKLIWNYQLSYKKVSF